MPPRFPHGDCRPNLTSGSCTHTAALPLSRWASLPPPEAVLLALLARASALRERARQALSVHRTSLAEVQAINRRLATRVAMATRLVDVVTDPEAGFQVR